MNLDKAVRKARENSKKSARYIVYDGEEFGADNVGQGGFQVATDEDLEGFYQGCTIHACYENGELQ